jgi:hypothetical protein
MATSTKPKKRASAAKKAARPKKECPECGLKVTGNNFNRHLTTHGATPARKSGRQPGKMDAERAASMGEKKIATVAIRNYLQSLEDNGTDWGTANVVTLSGVPGLNNGKYTDPEIVEDAAQRVLAAADQETNVLVKIKLRQRARNYVAAAESLRNNSNGHSPKSQFIKFGAAWAIENSIDYETFRDMGVPASVLKEAGIAR